MSDPKAAATLAQALEARFGERLAVDPALTGLESLARLADHRVHRRWTDKPVDPAVLRLLCACALSSPTKSDLQQGDIVVVRDMAKRRAISSLIPDMPWMDQAPVFLVFCGNGSRLPRIAALRGKPFPNDHLDAFFNAVVDGTIVMTAFIAAAEAIGLGCVPISVIRDHARVVAEQLALPPRVVPIAGLCVGWPDGPGRLSPRLAIDVRVHVDRYDESALEVRLDEYDRRRHETAPFARQRKPERWGEVPFYGWSEDKARQYAEPQRVDFGAFVRAQGFKLD
ncbi:MAG TPA: nitroreductase family protein [Candidatus Sulfotelmatobacter sp.]|nr:nitroreductase family protein [Candidatus Sulfotelmatobacter sp.]